MSVLDCQKPHLAMSPSSLMFAQQYALRRAAQTTQGHQRLAFPKFSFGPRHLPSAGADAMENASCDARCDSPKST
jgi:hypothetical protein